MSVRGVFFLRYQPPALAPVLEAALSPGGTFFDVGAHIGVYSMWASRLVGEHGSVIAFEAAPATRERLVRTIQLNGIGNVQVVPKAVGEKSGTLEFHAVPHATGLASATAPDCEFDIESITVESTSLDDHLVAARCRVPQLVKIDVEGYEFHVLRGASEVLTKPESPRQFGEIVKWLEDEVGYQVFGMLPRGLMRTGSDARRPMSSNSLAARPDRHASVLERLSRRRFRRNQTW
jgi:FkbM family methyltransferase